jgi:hypothetical protein
LFVCVYAARVMTPVRAVVACDAVCATANDDAFVNFPRIATRAVSAALGGRAVVGAAHDGRAVDDPIVVIIMTLVIVFA